MDTDQPATDHSMPLGRLVQFDERSRQFSIRELIASSTAPRSYTWRCDTYLDQASSSSCVGHSWAHEIIARPAVDHVDSAYAYSVYHRAQQIDEWPGAEPSYYGTSVLAGAKATKETGRIAEYRWAFGIDDMIMAVGRKGPAVVGTAWYEGMFYPDAEGVMKPTGRVSGGHAYLVKGVSLKKEQFRIHNSWGKSWGKGGDAYISFEDMDRLLKEQGECCIPVKRVRSH